MSFFTDIHDVPTLQLVNQLRELIARRNTALEQGDCPYCAAPLQDRANVTAHQCRYKDNPSQFHVPVTLVGVTSVGLNVLSADDVPFHINQQVRFIDRTTEEPLLKHVGETPPWAELSYDGRHNAALAIAGPRHMNDFLVQMEAGGTVMIHPIREGYIIDVDYKVGTAVISNMSGQRWTVSREDIYLNLDKAKNARWQVLLAKSKPQA